MYNLLLLWQWMLSAAASVVLIRICGLSISSDLFYKQFWRWTFSLLSDMSPLSRRREQNFPIPIFTITSSSMVHTSFTMSLLSQCPILHFCVYLFIRSIFFFSSFFSSSSSSRSPSHCPSNSPLSSLYFLFLIFLISSLCSLHPSHTFPVHIIHHLFLPFFCSPSRSHSHSGSLPLCLCSCLCLSVCLCVSLVSGFQSVCLSLFLSLYLTLSHMSACLPISLSLTVHLAFCMSASVCPL